MALITDDQVHRRNVEIEGVIAHGVDHGDRDFFVLAAQVKYSWTARAWFGGQ